MIFVLDTAIDILDTQTGFFAPVTLTLTRWPWYTKLTKIFWWCTCIPK